ncbi:MAG: FtsX-like permease family protein [Allobaculum sp.]|nr:FtsX-like permease family protein [Allobaculum sp.]
MKKHMYWSLALQSLKKNYRISLPFLGGSVIMTAMFYSITSLAFNPELTQTFGGNVMRELLGFGERIMMLFTLIFFFYLNSVLFKNRRQENGLFTILGMEKGHLIRIEFYQILVLFLVTLGIGLLLGIGLDKILFMLILKFSGMDPSFGFYISHEGLQDTIFWIGLCYLAILIWSILSTLRSNPLEALHGKQVGEKPIKNRWLLALLGILCLGSGYAIALSVKDPIAALIFFFLAVILVILGTYLLFAFGSTVIVQILQNNKRFYYKPSHFVSVSTMRYRLKQNGMALANIAILSTMVLVALSTTTALLAGIDSSLDRQYPRNFIVNLFSTSSLPEEIAFNEESFVSGLPTANGLMSTQAIEEKVLAIAQEYGLDPNNPEVILRDGLVVQTEEGLSFQTPVIDLADFNRIVNGNYILSPGEMISLTPEIPTGTLLYSQMEEETDPILIKEVVNRPEILDFLINSLDERQAMLVGDLKEVNSTNLHVFVLFDSDTDESSKSVLDFYHTLEENFPEVDVLTVRTKASDKEEILSVYSGILFIGIYLSVLFLLAVILIMYYKQLSEGLEDQKRFAIMQNIGLEAKQIHKIINDQVIVMFFLPLGVALMHLCFAYPMIQKILNMLTMGENRVFLLVSAICFLIFALIYIIIYKLTAQTYFKLTCQPQNR